MEECILLTVSLALFATFETIFRKKWIMEVHRYVMEVQSWIMEIQNTFGKIGMFDSEDTVLSRSTSASFMLNVRFFSVPHT